MPSFRAKDHVVHFSLVRVEPKNWVGRGCVPEENTACLVTREEGSLFDVILETPRVRPPDHNELLCIVLLFKLDQCK
jgi:hypothetical protein